MFNIPGKSYSFFIFVCIFFIDDVMVTATSSGQFNYRKRPLPAGRGCCGGRGRGALPASASNNSEAEAKPEVIDPALALLPPTYWDIITDEFLLSVNVAPRSARRARVQPIFTKEALSAYFQENCFSGKVDSTGESLIEAPGNVVVCLEDPTIQSPTLGRNFFHALCYLPEKHRDQAVILKAFTEHSKTHFTHEQIIFSLQQLDAQGFTPLQCAVFRGRIPLVNIFTQLMLGYRLPIGAEVRGVRKGPESILKLAFSLQAKNKRVIVLGILLRALVNSGEDINALKNELRCHDRVLVNQLRDQIFAALWGVAPVYSGRGYNSYRP